MRRSPPSAAIRSIWKPSHLTPLTAIAVQNIVQRRAGAARPRGRAESVRRRSRRRPGDGRRSALAADLRDRQHRDGQERRQSRSRQRLGRTLLELGGNNGCIVTESADLDLGAASDSLRRRRHRGTTLHHVAPAHRARIASRSELVARLTQAYRQRHGRSAVGRRNACSAR